MKIKRGPIILWMGKPIQDMTKDDLIEALNIAVGLYTDSLDEGLEKYLS